VVIKRKTRLRILIVVAFVLFTAPAGFSLWLYSELHAPVSHGKSNDYIEIPRRSTPEGIANKLLAEGVIRRTWPLLFYIKLTGSAKLIKAGDYRFPSPVSALGVLRKLEEGEQRLSRFAVIEGWTRWDVAESLARVPELHLRDKDEALALWMIRLASTISTRRRRIWKAISFRRPTVFPTIPNQPR